MSIALSLATNGYVCPPIPPVQLIIEGLVPIVSTDPPTVDLIPATKATEEP